MCTVIFIYSYKTCVRNQSTLSSSMNIKFMIIILTKYIYLNLIIIKKICVQCIYLNETEAEAQP